MRPVVVGLGPAGLFAALLLARRGFRPLVLGTRPRAGRTRFGPSSILRRPATLDPNANIQFGEGGAGTFSDGKLTTRVGDPLCAFVTGAFLAPRRARRTLRGGRSPTSAPTCCAASSAASGGEIERAGRRGAVQHGPDRPAHPKTVPWPASRPRRATVPCEQMILAVGHSARDTFAMLHGFGPAAGVQAVLRRLPRRAPANRNRQEPLPRRRRPPGAAGGRVPAQPARHRRAVRLHLLHVPRAARSAPPPARQAPWSPTA